jgi:hypothetical protein
MNQVKTLPQLRHYTGSRDDPIFPREDLKTAISVDKEYWIVLRLDADVYSTGKKLLRSYGIQEDIRKKWLVFRSYIHQAENYWYAAIKTSPKSAALLYYYCFLNLVKAFLILKNYPLPNANEVHGISTKGNIWKRGAENKAVKILLSTENRFSIFEKYYQEIFNQSPPSKINIWRLLSYATDVSYQYQAISRKFGSCFPIIHRLVADSNRKKSWIVIAIPRSASLEKHKSAFKDFLDEFEKIETPKTADLGFRDLFGFESMEWSGFEFYQTKPDKELDMTDDRIPIYALLDKIKGTLKFQIAPNYNPDKFTGMINLPINRVVTQPVNEEVAIYCVMFFMSELIRYHTDYLDKILTTNAGWVLESFVESCPLKFLRIITSRIKQRTIRISNF